MKFLRIPLCGLLLVLSAYSARAGGESPVATPIRSFYQWYIPFLEVTEDKDILKKHRKEMSRYVTANRLAKLARVSADSQEGDYFLESLDVDQEWAKNIEVRNVKTGARGRATAEVRLTGKVSPNVNLKITLALEGGTYKIDEVDGLPDFGAMAAAQLRAFYAQYLHYLAYAASDEGPMGQQDMREGFTKEGLVKATTKDAASAKTHYLLQSEDWDPVWEEHIEIKQVDIVPDGSHGTAEIVLMGEKIPKAHLKVSLKQEKDTFKIDGVERLAD